MRRMVLALVFAASMAVSVGAITYGTPDTPSRRYMGPLPAAGRWVRLKVPAALVGLEGTSIKGMSFTLQGGTAVWDRAGKLTPR